jgi:hypothetical protein
MKKRAFLLRIVAFMLTFGLIITGCGGGINDVDDDTTSPGPVTNITTIGGNEKITLSWTEPSDTDFDSVEITYKPDGSSPITVKKGTVAKEITGLTNDTDYIFTVKSVDASGNKSSGATVMARAGNTPLKWAKVGNSNFGANNICSIAHGGGKFVAGGWYILLTGPHGLRCGLR